MKLPCYIARDLLPLYKDEVCDKQTAADVKEHLDGCPGCTAALAALDGDPAAAAMAAERHTDAAAALAKVKKSLFQKRVGAALAAAAVLVCGYWAAFFVLDSWLINVTPDHYSIVEEEGTFYLLPDDGAGICRLGAGVAQYDGQTVLLVHSYTTLWNRLTGQGIVLADRLQISTEFDVAAVYYEPVREGPRTNEMHATDLDTLPEGAVLLWDHQQAMVGRLEQTQRALETTLQSALQP